MLDGVGRAVLTVLHGDFIHVAETAEDEGSSALNVDFPVQSVHDVMAEAHRTNERLRGLRRLTVRNGPVVLQTDQQFAGV